MLLQGMLSCTFLPMRWERWMLHPFRIPLQGGVFYSVLLFLVYHRTDGGK